MNLLFVANFAADTGYAWDTIERVFRRVGEQLVTEGHTVTIAYASMPNGPSRVMQGAPFRFIAFPYDTVTSLSGLRTFLRVLRDHHIDALYLTDRPTAAWQYFFYRMAGVRRLIVHDRTSGDRSNRSAAHWWLKRTAHRSRLLSADCCIAISRFVRDRLIRTAGVPAGRTRLVYNGIEVGLFETSDRHLLAKELGIPAETPIVFCSGRAQHYKGIHIVIDAAALLKQRVRTDVVFAYCGDGPYLEELRTRAASHGLDNFVFMGKRSDIPRLLGSATIAVVPSIWAEAFGLTVVESMAAGVPVIATRTGGIPELINDDAGVIIDPGDADALARALDGLLQDPARRAALASRGRDQARERFSLEVCAHNLHAVVSSELAQVESTRPSASRANPANVEESLTASVSR